MAVIIRVFEPPLSAASPKFVNAGMVTEATEIDIMERLYTPGYFSITVPAGARHADRLKAGRLVLIDGSFWGIIDDEGSPWTGDGCYITISGRQLKGITKDRITLPPETSGVVGTQGYDTATGDTESVMKHFVAANLGADASPARQVYGLEIAAQRGRGLQDDKYISRHDNLADVLAALGEAAGLGYDVTPDLENSKLIFDVVAGLDHRGSQSDRMRVIFDVARKTALSQSYTRSAADARNVFYATLGGAEFEDEALTAKYILDDADEPAGLLRREKHLAVSVDTPVAGDEYNEMKRLALIQAEDYRVAESFLCEIPLGGRYEYRRDFNLGDIVTVRNGQIGVTMDTRITEMETQWSSAGKVLTATFGKAPINVFGQLKRQMKG